MAKPTLQIAGGIKTGGIPDTLCTTPCSYQTTKQDTEAKETGWYGNTNGTTFRIVGMSSTVHATED